MMGISLANKIDYALFLPILAGITLIKRLSFKNIIICLLLFLLMPALSWGILVLQGFNFTDYINYLHFFKSYISSHSLKADFTAHYSFPLTEKICFWIVTFAHLFLIMLRLAIPAYFISLKLDKCNLIKKICLKAIFILLAAPVVLSQIKNLHLNVNLFSWLTISSIGIIVLLFIKRKEAISLANRNILVLLLLISIAATGRTDFYISCSYGYYLGVLALLINVVFLLDYLPFYLGFINKNHKKMLTITLLLLGLTFILNILTADIKITNYPIKTSKGTLYSTKIMGPVIDKTIKYINNLPENTSILVLPEGALLNFLTNKSSIDKYIYLTPPQIEPLGEQNIVNSLKIDGPDYFIINNLNYKGCGVKHFCEDFGLKVCKFMNMHYKLEKKIGTVFNVRIYKKVKGTSKN